MTCGGVWTPLKSVAPAHTNARSPSSAHAELIISTVSAGDSTGMLPEAKQIGGGPAAIHDITSSSAEVVSSMVRAPTKGRRPPYFAHSSASPRKHTAS
ncbi:Uncharacterised protein [Mycobacteroides abscessus subsp. abscessus]|nr:Uncharacterised protein [Mycobacteroides abscessus subsp. abscessus]